MKTFSVEDLQLFVGTKEQACDAAMRDQEQFIVDKVLSYKGDSTKRTEMVFKVKFADGDIVDLPWTHDLLCDVYYEYCESIPHLKHLSLDTKMAKVFITHQRKLDISSVSIGDVVYADLRYFGDLWYESLKLPDNEYLSCMWCNLNTPTGTIKVLRRKCQSYTCWEEHHMPWTTTLCTVGEVSNN